METISGVGWPPDAEATLGGVFTSTGYNLIGDGSGSGIVYRDLPVDDPKVRQPDITKARRLLEWEPRVDLDEGLARTVVYFRRKLDSKREVGA